MAQKISASINKIFYHVQFNKTCHQNNLKKLRKLYDESTLSDFWEVFVSCLKVPLSVSQHHSRINNTLEFAAKFAVSLYTVTDDEQSEDPLCPFLTNLFEFIFNNHRAKDPGVRYRICHFLNILLNSMGDQAFMADELCEKITVSMMSRLLDKSYKVRAQAILALHRLQDPSNDECPVIKMYIFHASKDPKAEVRKAALMCMGKNQKTLQVALRRTRDIDEMVRKIAYQFISKVTVRSLTIAQRDQLLNDGLKDRSEAVRKTVENVLLPSWLRHFQGNFIDLVRALDAEIGTDVSVLALKSLFENTPVNVLIEQLPIDKETKLIPIDNLVSENVLYWKCLVNYFHKDSRTEELESILPELSTFCTYISDFQVKVFENQNKTWESHMLNFILLQLFEIVTTYDLSDEVGRKKLNDLICNTLMTDYCTESIIECIVSHLQKVIPDTNSRLDTLANIISEIRLPLRETQTTQISEEQQHEINLQRAKLRVKLLELKELEYQAIAEQQYLKADTLKNQIIELNEEIKKLSEKPQLTVMEEIKEKNDPETMRKCLNIICVMMQSVTVLTPTLRSLMQIALDSLDHPDDNVHILAVRALSICCILDKELAKKHIMMLILQFSLEQENPEIWIIALKGIFDLLLLYGLEHFDILQQPEESNTTNKSNKSNTTKLYTDTDMEVSLSSTRKSDTENGNRNFIKILAGLLDNAHQGLRTTATEGLCKLLLNQRINSSNLISRLIILCFNPINDNDYYLRQCLSCFFDNFMTRVPDAHELLEQAYLPTLQTLCKAPEISPLKEIDAYDVSRFILNLTSFSCVKSDAEHYCSHNNFAFMILAEILNPHSKIDTAVLVKSLKDLHIEIHDNVSKKNIREAIIKITDMIKDWDKRLMKYVEVFKKKLESPNVDNTPEDEDTENED
ncbi:chromosome associated protein G [Megachile rotundata]|uniref:chromosome associated protein G n=1 Tax=Megachile rotundata TaxID=143995 RepID=UPI000258EB37|nr:PREDICTED: condensin complex subunit 3 [Megachile rotundata]